MKKMETVEVLQIFERLIGSVWTFSALSYAAEKGVLEQLDEPRTLSYVSEHAEVPIALVERILDILVALNLAQREGDTYTADKGLLPLVTPPRKAFFLGNLKSNYFESRNLIDSARQPITELGWSFTEPEILQSMGKAAFRLGDSIFRELVPKLGDLASRLQVPSARFLDVGCGMGGISIAACRFLPNLCAVGLEPQDAPLNEARQNITAAGLADRIELRKQAVEDMADEEAFELIYFPQSFMSDEVVKRGLRNIWKALRPGGWVLVQTIAIPGIELQAALSRLRDTLMGGSARIPSQVETMLSDANFISISTLASSVVPTFHFIAGQRPT
jgi:precorrin-6B methylase 2